jgi:hypothetical protein
VRSPAAPAERGDPVPSAAPAVERPSVDDSDADQRVLQRVLEFKRRYEARSERQEVRAGRPQESRAERQESRAERQEPRGERQEPRSERLESRGARLSVDELDDDRREVEHILDLQRRQEVRIGSWLVLTVVLAASLIVVAQLPPVKDFLNRTRPATPSEQSQQASNLPTATPQVVTPPDTSPPVATAPTPPIAAQEPPPAAESPATPQSSPRVETPPASRPAPPVSRALPPAAPVRPAERPAAAAPREPALPRATSSAMSPSPSFSELRSQSGARPSVASAQFPGLPRVEVIRDSASASGGRGAAYAVRISDTAGRPLSGAEVMLLARMSDGSVENITLGSGAEPGSYQGALPGQSAPVDLRVRVITNDKRVEIPLKP